jgi:hypothetical protein
MPQVNGQYTTPGVFTAVQNNVLPTGGQGVRVPALIGTGRTTNLVSNEQVTRGATSMDSLAYTATAIDGNIQDQNYVTYYNGVDFAESGGKVEWLSNVAQLTGTTLGSSYTNALVGETFILAIASGTLWAKTFAVADFEDANDSTVAVPFAITSVVDGTHLQVNSTAGMSNGNILVQGSNSTTIINILDNNHLQVESTTGWVEGNAVDVSVNLPFNYQITALNNPTSYAASGYPTGLSIDDTNGLLSGVPTETGIFQVTLSATNSVGTGTQNLNLTVS